MNCVEPKIAQFFLEMISLMGKRYVMTEWPSLIPELSSHLNGQNLENMRRSLEAIKKICKKYRYMFRSDNLYREMNYIIENLSQLLLDCLISAVTQISEITAKL